MVNEPIEPWVTVDGELVPAGHPGRLLDAGMTGCWHIMAEDPHVRQYDSTGAYSVEHCARPGCQRAVLGRQLEWAGL
jgi:hypothetical protein